MQDFRKLRIWQRSFQLTKEIYKLSKKFPNREVFGITSQLRRASVSISNNIAEGCDRRTKKELVAFLYNSMGSIKECENLLLIAESLGHSSSKDTKGLLQELNELGKMLPSLIRKIK